MTTGSQRNENINVTDGWSTVGRMEARNNTRKKYAIHYIKLWTDNNHRDRERREVMTRTELRIFVQQSQIDGHPTVHGTQTCNNHNNKHAMPAPPNSCDQ